MANTFERLKTALADRYASELGLDCLKFNFPESVASVWRQGKAILANEPISFRRAPDRDC